MSTSSSTSIRGPYRTKIRAHRDTSVNENKRLYKRLSEFSELLKNEHPISSSRSYILEEFQRLRDRIQKAIKAETKEYEKEHETREIEISQLAQRIEEQQKEIEELKRQQSKNEMNLLKNINFEFDL